MAYIPSGFNYSRGGGGGDEDPYFGWIALVSIVIALIFIAVST